MTTNPQALQSVILPPPVLQSTVQPAPSIQTTLTVGQGPAGPTGPTGPSGGDLTGAAATTLNGHRAVAWQAGELVHADSSSLEHLFALAGVVESAAAAGDSVSVRSSGVITYSGWSWVAGPVWYGADGALTQTQPSGYPRVIGRGDGQRLFIDIQPPVQVI